MASLLRQPPKPHDQMRVKPERKKRKTKKVKPGK
jgi:hypothetical protein